MVESSATLRSAGVGMRERHFKDTVGNVYVKRGWGRDLGRDVIQAQLERLARLRLARFYVARVHVERRGCG